MARHLLKDIHIKNARRKAKAYRLRDGDGLFLYVPPSGVRSWQFRYKLGGKGQTSTLGKCDNLSLAEARQRAAEARALVEKGEHVTTIKRLAKAQSVTASATTFARFSETWIKVEAKRAGWTSDYREEVTASLRNHLGDLNLLPVTSITAAIAAPSLRRCERSAPDMAKKVRQRLRAILDMAVEDGIIAFNPLPAPRRRKSATQRKHLPALLAAEEVGTVLRRADVAELSRGVRRAHLLAAFTAQRIGEIVPAQWNEFDLKAGTWSIPRARMKRKDAERGDHVIPLSPVLLGWLKEWKRADGDHAEYVCPAPSNSDRNQNYITREAVEKFYRRGLDLSGRHSPHSWRSVFSTWSRDAGKDGDLVEAQLDHSIGSKTQAAYDRARRLELRRGLMGWYEARLLSARDGAAVIPLRSEA
ncbi:MAG: integrase arm-type DNA-binding domain-containing protein [Burkholderiales bacterium]